MLIHVTFPMALSVYLLFLIPMAVFCVAALTITVNTHHGRDSAARAPNVNSWGMVMGALWPVSAPLALALMIVSFVVIARRAMRDA